MIMVIDTAILVSAYREAGHLICKSRSWLLDFARQPPPPFHWRQYESWLSMLL
ncbi:hypothetical protein PM082_016678 [Marasmius tenuissimus]|nr:hypothetical protein PM082_016678 [Marasmius tenuissimus]